MKIRHTVVMPIVLGFSLGAVLLGTANAMDREQCDARPGPRMMMHGPGGHGMGHFDDEAPLPPFMRALNLSETQRDQIFKIMHDQAPALRDKAKEAHKARSELHAMGFSANYDEAKATALAESGAQAMAAMARMRAASANQIYQLLTPEQRKKAEELKREFESRREPHAMMPPRGIDELPPARRR